MEITKEGQSVNLTFFVCEAASIYRGNNEPPVDLSPLTEALKSKSDQPIYIKLQFFSDLNHLFINRLGFLDKKEEFQVDTEGIAFPTVSYVDGNWDGWTYQKGKLLLHVDEIPIINGVYSKRTKLSNIFIVVQAMYRAFIIC